MLDGVRLRRPDTVTFGPRPIATSRLCREDAGAIAMPMTREQILAEVKSLDPREREELIEDLRRIVHDDELTPEQLAEIHRRVAEMDRGEAVMIPGEQVMRELRERLRRR